MCPVGTPDCVDADLGDGGDPIIAPDIHVVDALPADIRMVEMDGTALTRSRCSSRRRSSTAPAWT